MNVLVLRVGKNKKEKLYSFIGKEKGVLKGGGKEGRTVQSSARS